VDNRVEPGTRLADGEGDTAAPEPDAAVQKADTPKPAPGDRGGSNGNGTEKSASSSATVTKPSASGKVNPAPVEPAEPAADVTVAAPFSASSPSADPPRPSSADPAGSSSADPPRPPNADPVGSPSADPARSPSASAANTPVSSQTVPRPTSPSATGADPPRTPSGPFTGQPAARPAGPASGLPGAAGMPSFATPASATSSQLTDLPSAARPGQAAAVPVPSGKAKSKIMAPFSTLTKKKTKPAKTGRPGSAIKTGNAATTARKAAPQSRPAARLTPKGASPDGAQSRDAQLVVSRIEPWSVMKFSFMISLVGWVVLFVAVALLYYALSSLGVFHQIEQTIGLVTSTKNTAGSNAASWFSASTILGYTMLAGAIDVVLITALATVGAVVYNLVTNLSGGIEITLQEAD